MVTFLKFVRASSQNHQNKHAQRIRNIRNIDQKKLTIDQKFKFTKGNYGKISI